MSNLSIALTFSEDGEYLQLSRMDAAILLTWIMGGDHDNEPDVTLSSPLTEKPASKAPEPSATQEEVSSTATSAEEPSPSIQNESTKASSESSKQQVFLPKSPPAKEPILETERKNAAARIVRDSVSVPDVPFSVTPKSAEFATPPAPPSPNELIEEEPYWAFGDAPIPSAKD